MALLRLAIAVLNDVRNVPERVPETTPNGDIFPLLSRASRSLALDIGGPRKIVRDSTSHVLKLNAVLSICSSRANNLALR